MIQRQPWPLFLAADLDVPLLGTGGKIALEDLTQAERSVLYDIRAFSLYRKSFVVSIITDYYRILQQKDSVTNAENNYQRVLESRDRLNMETWPADVTGLKWIARNTGAQRTKRQGCGPAEL